jgi:hypothetical protein
MILPVTATGGVADALRASTPVGAAILAGAGADTVTVDRWLAAAHPALAYAALLAFRGARRGVLLPDTAWEAHRSTLVHLSRRAAGVRAIGSARP